MNFLFHRRLATRDLGSRVAGAGAMLPDLWRIADRRVRARPGVPPPATGTASPLPADGPRASRAGKALGEVLAGIEHHLAADAWFHRSAVFRDGERRTVEEFRAAGVLAPRMGLFAHLAWELCLDGALVRRDGLDATLDELRRGLASCAGDPADGAADLHHFRDAGRPPALREAFRARMAGITERLVAGPWIAAYADEPGVAEIVSTIRGRLGVPPLDEADLARTAAALRALRDLADAAAGELLAASF